MYVRWGTNGLCNGAFSSRVGRVLIGGPFDRGILLPRAGHLTWHQFPHNRCMHLPAHIHPDAKLCAQKDYPTVGAEGRATLLQMGPCAT